MTNLHYTTEYTVKGEDSVIDHDMYTTMRYSTDTLRCDELYVYLDASKLLIKLALELPNGLMKYTSSYIHSELSIVYQEK